MALATLALIGCGSDDAGPGAPPEPGPVEGDPVGWIARHADAYLDEAPAWRRARLEEALWRPDLAYSRSLLDYYGRSSGGWEYLPELVVRWAPVMADPEAPRPALRALEVTETPETPEAWVELGERVFWSMPMRRDAYLEWLVERPERWRAAGVQENERGELRGIVRFTDTRGRERVGMSCGLCHGEGGRAGVSHAALDLGKARALWLEARGLETAPFDSWGPGVVDVTDDAINDPLAIPSLWGAKHQSYFNASGSIRAETPAAAAARFETQYIINHGYEARPARALTWGLAAFLYSIEAPEAPRAEAPARGAEVFAARCASCHDPERGWSGDLIPAAALSLDQRAAASPKRGTSFYRVPSLVGLAHAAPYFHDASAQTLSEVVDGGHPAGASIEPADRDALLAYLETL